MCYTKKIKHFNYQKKGRENWPKVILKICRVFLKLIKYINLEIWKFMFSLSRDTDKTTLDQLEWENQKIENSILNGVWKKKNMTFFRSDQIRSVAHSCPTLCAWIAACEALPLHHHLPEFTQTHVHRVGGAIQPSHPRSSPSPPAPNPSQHQSLFQWVNFSHEVAKVLEFQL